LNLFRTTGDRVHDEYLNRLEARVNQLESQVSNSTTAQTVVTPSVPSVVSGNIEVSTSDGTYDAQVGGLEFDQAYGFVLSTDGNLAKVQLPTLSTGDLSTSGDFAHTGSGKKIGFFGATTVVRTAAYTMTYSTGSRTNSAPTAAAVATTAATLAAYGYTQAQADSIPVAINALVADVLNLKQVLTQVIKDLQSYGLLQ
jgi:hypothetical protein